MTPRIGTILLITWMATGTPCHQFLEREAQLGRPFVEELAQLVGTADWAVDVNLQSAHLCQVPTSEHLVSVGSGGSHSAAVYAALLHRMRSGQSTVATPLEFLDACYVAPPEHVLLTSAGGGNKDIVAAGRAAVQAEARSVTALCMSSDTKLGGLVRTYHRGYVAELAVPSGKDGFLATNSLFATMIVLARAFRVDVSSVPELVRARADILSEWDIAVSRPDWLVLYGGWAWPAAHDIESKCSEAALRNVQLTDLRNFGHGRHHWLAKRGETSGVFVLADPAHSDLAEKTIRLLPKDIPVVRLFTNQAGPLGTIDLMPSVYSLIQKAGSTVGIDPGRPGVPEFGRQLYHLGPGLSAPRSASKATASLVSAGVRRKLGKTLLSQDAVDNALLRAGQVYLQSLRKAKFSAIVLDYDGTIVGAGERFAGPRADISSQLNRLLEGGMVLGIATGRGKSVRKDLRKVIEERNWPKVLLGYYNGGQIIMLDGEEPDSSTPPPSVLAQVAEILQVDDSIRHAVKIESRPTQLSVTPLDFSDWKRLRQRVIEIISNARVPLIKVLESTHSIDVLPFDVTKVSVVEASERLAALHGRPGAILRIGDCGAWPGNDSELLSSGFSLSVDACSADPRSCWNLLPAGMGGVEGTLFYLEHLRLEAGTWCFEVAK